jgi:hypothetical protein
MYNRDRNLLTFWQNLEFVVWARIFSRAKDRLGSATLGGNGQCVRLSALISLGASPWRPSLTEDLDLSLRLILNGGRIRFCSEAHVAQEAAEHVRQLVRQRARWVQGHLVAWEHLPAILRSTLPLRVRVDLVAFLLLPVVLVPLALLTVGGWRIFLASLATLSLGTLLLWYLLAFWAAPLTVWALIRDGEVDRRRAIVQAHLFLGYSTMWMLAAGRATWSIIRGDRAWAKTSRNPASIGRTGAEVDKLGTPDEKRDRSLPKPRHGRQSGVGVVGIMAAIAMVASSTLVLIAAVAGFATYGEVTRAGAQALAGDRTGAGATPPLSSPRRDGFARVDPSAQLPEPIARPSSSPPATLTPGPAEGRTVRSAKSPAPTPSPKPTPKPRPAPTPTPTPAPTPAVVCRTVPILIGLTVSDARVAWTAAGFTGSFSPANGRNNSIVQTQSQAAGACLPTTTTIAVT